MRIIILSVSLLCCLMTFPALSAWQLTNDTSSLSFISIKKGDIAEAHHFKELSGQLNDNGKVNFVIDLLSVDTNVAIRDQRMKQFLFHTKVYPKASFTSQLNMKNFNAIAVGTSGVMKLQGDIDLHGEKHKVEVSVLVSKLSENNLVVSSMKPVLLNAKSFKLDAGVTKLKELAVLPDVSNAVPVSFVLSFSR